MEIQEQILEQLKQINAKLDSMMGVQAEEMKMALTVMSRMYGIGSEEQDEEGSSIDES